MKTIEIQSKHNQNATLKPNTCECIKIHLIYLPHKTIPVMFSIANIVQHYYCLSNAIHCMGQNIKSLAACVCVCVCAPVLGLNISKTVTDRGSVTMGH